MGDLRTGIVVDLIGDAVFAAEELGIQNYEVMPHILDDSGFLVVDKDEPINPVDDRAIRYAAFSLGYPPSMFEEAVVFGDITEPSLTVANAIELGYEKQ